MFMDYGKLVEHWVETSDKDFIAMETMFNGKQYSWSLFIGHLVLEKLLKALFVKVNLIEAPKIHNLIVLAEKSNLDLDKNMVQKLSIINTFNIDSRYEDEKKIFFKLCTKEFTQEQVENIKEIRQWLKQKLTGK